MMLFMLCTIWALGLFVLFTDPRRTPIRWASATAFVGGGGYLSGLIDEHILIAWADTLAAHPDLEQGLVLLSRTASFLCQTGLPYTFLLFAVHSSESLSAKTKTFVQILGLIPPLVMLAITPIYPVLSFNYWIMVAWVFPYFFAASFLLIGRYRDERDPLVKKNLFYTNLLIIVPLFLVFLLIYGMRIHNNYEAWRYNGWVVAIQFIVIIAVSLKYGFLGVRLRVEKRRLDSTLRALTSGVQIINHTVKNEVGKISLYADRIHDYAEQHNQPGLKEDATVLLQSAQHMLNMVDRIQTQLRDVNLREQSVPAAGLITEAIHALRPFTAKQQIEVVTELDERLQLLCDPALLREVLTNLCMNAIEAMKTGGVLNIQLFLSKKHLVVSVADTGAGISRENLARVLDPFFSTKKSGTNFGLGLSYCYHVMQKHQGLLELSSEPGAGTTVFLLFPKKRVAVRTSTARSESEETNR